MAFWLQSGKFGQCLLYILDEPIDGGPVAITGIHWVSVEGGETPDPADFIAASQPILSPPLQDDPRLPGRRGD